MAGSHDGDGMSLQDLGRRSEKVKGPTCFGLSAESQKAMAVSSLLELP